MPWNNIFKWMTEIRQSFWDSLMRQTWQGMCSTWFKGKSVLGSCSIGRDQQEGINRRFSSLMVSLKEYLLGTWELREIFKTWLKWNGRTGRTKQCFSARRVGELYRTRGSEVLCRKNNGVSRHTVKHKARVGLSRN